MSTTSALCGYLTSEEPFGPPEAERLSDADAQRLLFDRHNLVFAQASAVRPTYIIGRKGAGKTAFLGGTSIGSNRRIESLRTPAVYTAFIASVRKYEAAHGPLFVEQLAEMWGAVVYNVACWHICSDPKASDPASDLQIAWDYAKSEPGSTDASRFAEEFLGALTRRFDDPEARMDVGGLIDSYSRGGRRFCDLRAAVDRILDRRGGELAVVMDNLEDLHGQLEVLTPVLKGLFHCIGRWEDTVSLRIAVCLPAELYDRLYEFSATPDKDFRRVLTIHWSAREMLNLAGTRLRLFLADQHPDELMWLQKRSGADENDGLALLRAALPRIMRNGLGGEEDPIGYLLRHTQLLPRHLIVLLNRVFTATVADSLPWAVSEQAVLAGTRAAEKILVNAILAAYSGAYEELPKVLHPLGNRLPLRFPMSKLHQVFNREGIRRNTGLDFDQFVSVLFAIGAVGVFTTETDRYFEADFEYTYSGTLNAVEDQDDLCFHPLFTRYLHERTLKQLRGSKVVYPYGSNPAAGDYRFELGYVDRSVRVV